MSSTCLVIEVCLHQPRWLGAGEWPPSPWRLFQALLAGSGLGRGLQTPADETHALGWLEQLPAPTILVPASSRGQQILLYLPNNDLDHVGGRPSRVNEIRKATKRVVPHLLEPPATFLFVWQPHVAPSQEVRCAVQTLARRLFQLGRGEDAAYANAEFCDAQSLQARVASHRGQAFRPGPGHLLLRRPVPGSHAALRRRYAHQPDRLHGGLFRNLPPAPYTQSRYGSPADHLLFELHNATGLYAWPQRAAVALAIMVRDALASRLQQAGLDANLVDLFVKGRGARDQDKHRRVQIIPLPSIGSVHADGSIRRLLLRRPSACPIPATDLAWAMSSLDIGLNYVTGEVLRDSAPKLTPAADESMLSHYAANQTASSHCWQTVTPLALPWVGVHPTRTAREAALAHLVAQSLRHTDIPAAPIRIQLQREPFIRHGERAENFAAPARFAAPFLWHCAIEFTKPVSGPVIIGDGRFLGLGLCAPALKPPPDVFLWTIAARHRPALGRAPQLLLALRRALMGLAADPQGCVPTLFSGHASGPGPARSGEHRHAYLAALDRDADGRLDTLVAAAPWRLDRSWTPKRHERDQFSSTAERLRELVAGPLGRLTLTPSDSSRDPFLATAAIWHSLTPYSPTRHARHSSDWPAALQRDLATECARRALPIPQIVIEALRPGPRGGTRAQLALSFPSPITGPLALGCTAHAGGGWFTSAPPEQTIG